MISVFIRTDEVDKDTVFMSKTDFFQKNVAGLL